jgi:hypothetical protein
VALEVNAPAPWEGNGVPWRQERQPFDTPVLPTIERRTARATWSDWVHPALRIGVRSGVDRWTTHAGRRGWPEPRPSQ